MTAEELILAVRASLRGMPGAAKLHTVQDAQRVAAQAAKRAAYFALLVCIRPMI